ncbi:hypothetical protein [Calidifontibacillus erzurumensis]|uniref:hypothetical protein n=1 Tax=Calidifontibacillus erzurumensis TaxID=2741433 RepID=UPI0035B51284
MNKILLAIGVLLIFASFCFYLLGLMRIFPFFYTAIPLFLSIFFTVQIWNNRNRFRMRPRRKSSQH